MNTDTGRLYRIGVNLDTQPQVAQQRLEELEQTRGLFADEQAALEDLRAGATIVPVSEQVAQQMIVGGREFERRRRRNKAAKASRKANR